ncbi:MAG: (d)CMP kinase [Phycisphaerae bacterium]
MIIAIDGPAGSGKSAVATELARKLGFVHLDTGAMYRAVALAALEAGVISDPHAVAELSRNVRIDLHFAVEPTEVLLNGRDVTADIRRPEVTNVTYCAADNPEVRAELVRQQRLIASRIESLVTEGRDQGTVVFPNAEFKFFIDAQPQERARRRVHQLTLKGIDAPYETVLQELLKRDERDRSRLVGPLKPADDSITIDSTEMNLSEVVTMLAQLVAAGRSGT